MLSTGVHRRPLASSRGTRASSMASRPSAVSPMRSPCVRFGLFNYLLLPRSGLFFLGMALYYDLPEPAQLGQEYLQLLADKRPFKFMI